MSDAHQICRWHKADGIAKITEDGLKSQKDFDRLEFWALSNPMWVCGRKCNLQPSDRKTQYRKVGGTWFSRCSSLFQLRAFYYYYFPALPYVPFPRLSGEDLNCQESKKKINGDFIKIYCARLFLDWRKWNWWIEKNSPKLGERNPVGHRSLSLVHSFQVKNANQLSAYSPQLSLFYCALILHRVFLSRWYRARP